MTYVILRLLSFLINTMEALMHASKTAVYQVALAVVISWAALVALLLGVGALLTSLYLAIAQQIGPPYALLIIGVLLLIGSWVGLMLAGNMIKRRS